MVSIQEPCLGRTLTATLQRTDRGLCVLLKGGDLSHVGAVSLADETGKVQTLELPEHRDGFISGKWAKELSLRYHLPVSMTCGIHYNDASKKQLEIIVSTCDKLLRQLELSLYN